MKQNLDSLFAEIDQIKDNGDLVFIKFDGEREINKLTFIISFNKNNISNQIRFNGDDLKDLIRRGIDLYNSSK